MIFEILLYIIINFNSYKELVLLMKNLNKFNINMINMTNSNMFLHYSV